MSKPTDQLPPHSIEAEQGVLGCVLLSPGDIATCQAKLRAGPDAFFDIRHKTLYSALLSMSAKREAIDMVTVPQCLRDTNKLESAGGLAYVLSLPGTVPSATNLQYYLDIVREKSTLRRLLSTCSEVSQRIVKMENTDLDELLFSVQSDVISAVNDSHDSSGEIWKIDELSSYDTSNDPNSVIGVHNGHTTRYLCRGHGAWIIAPSGVGKSSLNMQQAILWSLGKSFCGIGPARPLRCLYIQAENDKGDAAEQVQGIMHALGIDQFSDEFEQVQRNFLMVTERRLVGPKFCAWLERQISLHNADVVFVDPFLSFSGIDVSRQDQCSQFLRTALNPVLSDTGCVFIGVHHTGKPKEAKYAKDQTVFDAAYAGIGSSELVNWARAISVIVPKDSHRFEWRLAKRGARAWATHPNGEITTSLWLQHSRDRIYWEQIEPPEEFQPKEQGDRKGGGAPSKVKQLISIGLGPVIDSLTEPVGKNKLAEMLNRYAEKNDLDISLDTCKRAIEQLVKTGAIKKNNGEYAKS